MISSQIPSQNIISTVQSINSNARFNDELVSQVVAAGGVTSLTSNGSMGISGHTDISTPIPTLLEPTFDYVTFNISNYAQIMSMISFNPQVIIFLKQMLIFC